MAFKEPPNPVMQALVDDVLQVPENLPALIDWLQDEGDDPRGLLLYYANSAWEAALQGGTAPFKWEIKDHAEIRSFIIRQTEHRQTTKANWNPLGFLSRLASMFLLDKKNLYYLLRACLLVGPRDHWGVLHHSGVFSNRAQGWRPQYEQYRRAAVFRMSGGKERAALGRGLAGISYLISHYNDILKAAQAVYAKLKEPRPLLPGQYRLLGLTHWGSPCPQCFSPGLVKCLTTEGQVCLCVNHAGGRLVRGRYKGPKEFYLNNDEMGKGNIL